MRPEEEEGESKSLFSNRLKGTCFSKMSARKPLHRQLQPSSIDMSDIGGIQIKIKKREPGKLLSIAKQHPREKVGPS